MSRKSKKEGAPKHTYNGNIGKTARAEYGKLNPPVFWRNEAYMRNFVFFEGTEDRDLEENEIIGKALVYLANDVEQLLVWSQEMVVRMSLESYNRRYKNK